MCGWVGIFGSCEMERALRVAGDTLASRGPDGSGRRVVDGPALRAGLAHRRLAILDPTPAGSQPMHDPDRGISVVYNGEIYNSPALRRELEGRGVRFRSETDTEVLLLGWAEWGDKVLERIEGIFSFALVDERRGRVLLARDRLGVKPLYWAQLANGDIVAGSAPRAILALRPELRPHLDRVAMAQFLTLLWIPHPRTPWSAIKKLPPGSALTIERGRSHQWRYWVAPRPGDGHLQPSALRESLEEATRRQLLSDVPVGLLLSGGLDSSLLLELMVAYYREEALEAVTAGYDPAAQRLEIAPDDTRYARLVASRHPRVALSEVVIGGDPDVDLDELSWHFDDPVADPAAVSLYRLCQKSTTKVLLSGVGGEELFAGYPRHLALGLARRAARLPAPVRHVAAGASPWLQGAQPGPFYPARRNLLKLARAVGDRRPPHYWRMIAQLSHAEVEALLPGTADEAFDELDSQSPRLSSTSLAEALAFDREQFLPNLNLAYADKASMAASVEIRVPLLDEAVVSMTARADARSLITERVQKAPLRAAAVGLVPRPVIERPKTGFGGPARAWFQGDGSRSLRPRMEAAAEAGLVTAASARRLFTDAATGRVDSALAAWAIVCLQAWHARHVGEPTTRRWPPSSAEKWVAS